MTNENEGYFVGQPGLLLKSYKIVRQIGRGTFGSVFACVDQRSQKPCAVKIIRALRRYYDAGQAELQTLLQIQQLHCANIVEVADYFDLEPLHLCIVFPLLGATLLELLKANEYRGFNEDWTREIGRSFFRGLQAVHSSGRIHTDVKPENLMSRLKPQSTTVRGREFVHPPGADMVLIDLGSAVLVNQKRPPLVCTRQYRAPEVMLGLEYGQRLDVWAAGCVIFECLTGRTLFKTHNSAAHLCQIQKIVGPMPPQLFDQAVALNRSNLLEGFDVKTGQWLFPQCDDFEVQALLAAKPLEDEMRPFKYSTFHLIRWMLSWDASERPTVKQIGEHPFFAEATKETKGTQVNMANEAEKMIQAFVEGQIGADDLKRWYNLKK